LIKCGAKVNAKNYGGGTPLYSACNYGHIDVGKLLIEKGADFNAKSNSGNTPLHKAIGMKHVVRGRIECQK